MDTAEALRESRPVATRESLQGLQTAIQRAEGHPQAVLRNDEVGRDQSVDLGDHVDPGHVARFGLCADVVRNVENQNELGTPASLIRTFILDIRSFKGNVDFDVTKSFVVHIAEGLPTDPPSQAEFQILKDKGLLRAETAVIHGTAFDESDFAEMGQVGAKLIWSPQSNRVLYGKTTKISRSRSSTVS